MDVSGDGVRCVCMYWGVHCHLPGDLSSRVWHCALKVCFARMGIVVRRASRTRYRCTVEPFDMCNAAHTHGYVVAGSLLR